MLEHSFFLRTCEYKNKLSIKLEPKKQQASRSDVYFPDKIMFHIAKYQKSLY
jgi:hypothetical protein